MDMTYTISRMQQHINRAREREMRREAASIGMAALFAEMDQHSTPPPPLDGPAFHGYQQQDGTQ